MKTLKKFNFHLKSAQGNLPNLIFRGSLIELERKMRINLTPTEKILWNELKEKKLDRFKFRNQHSVFRYILDFYCLNKLLAVEIDGDMHKQRQDYDDYRNEFLKNKPPSGGFGGLLRINNE